MRHITDSEGVHWEADETGCLAKLQEVIVHVQ
jgi:hypothetical protein